MMFMRGGVYDMMDELGELVQALKERERLSFNKLPEDTELLFVFMDAIMETLAEVAEVVLEAWRGMCAAIFEVAQVALTAITNCFAPFVEAHRRGRMYARMQPVLGKRAAWYLAAHWPRRWLPRWSFD